MGRKGECGGVGAKAPPGRKKGMGVSQGQVVWDNTNVNGREGPGCKGLEEMGRECGGGGKGTNGRGRGQSGGK